MRITDIKAEIDAISDRIFYNDAKARKAFFESPFIKFLVERHEANLNSNKKVELRHSEITLLVRRYMEHAGENGNADTVAARILPRIFENNERKISPEELLLTVTVLKQNEMFEYNYFVAAISNPNGSSKDTAVALNRLRKNNTLIDENILAVSTAKHPIALEAGIGMLRSANIELTATGFSQISNSDAPINVCMALEELIELDTDLDEDEISTILLEKTNHNFADKVASGIKSLAQAGILDFANAEKLAAMETSRDTTYNLVLDKLLTLDCLDQTIFDKLMVPNCAWLATEESMDNLWDKLPVSLASKTTLEGMLDLAAKGDESLVCSVVRSLGDLENTNDIIGSLRDTASTQSDFDLDLDHVEKLLGVDAPAVGATMDATKFSLSNAQSDVLKAAGVSALSIFSIELAPYPQSVYEAFERLIDADITINDDLSEAILSIAETGNHDRLMNLVQNIEIRERMSYTARTGFDTDDEAESVRGADDDLDFSDDEFDHTRVSTMPAQIV